eukprot:tig00020553_g10756.t1
MGSPSPVSIVGVDLTCENLRRHVGAWATCTLTSRANSASLAPTDFAFIENGFGSYGPVVRDSNGDLTFNFTATLPTNATGAPIQLRFNPTIDETNATTASFSVIIINTTMQCPERVAAKRAFNCSGTASPNTATLGASDFAWPAFEQLPGNSSAAVESPTGVLAWTTDGIDSSLLVQASLPVDGGLFVLRWNESVGGGVIAAVSLDVIEASVRCIAVAGRLPVGVPLSCAVVAAEGSPPLEVSDFGLPFAEPAGSGSFSELAVNGSDIVFTYIPTSSIASPVVRIGFAASIDASNTLVPYDEAFNSTLEMVSATVSCDRTRLTVGSTMTCTVAGSNTSAPLRLSDFASLNVSSPELAAVGSFSPLEVEGGAAEAAKLTFTFKPFALSTEANLTLWYSYTSASNPEQRHVVGSSTGSLISVVDADLTCENLRRHVGAWATCTLTRRANSSSLASTDFIFPANGFGSYGQPVPTGDGDLTFNFTAALPTNDTGAPIQLRFNPAIDDTNATTASFSIVIINTTMQCPERVAAKRAFNCSGAASPNTATLGASDFALPAFEQLPGNSSASVESPNGVLAWTTDGVESSLLVQASLPVDGGLFVLRWNDSVGGGVIAAVSLDVIEASVRCVAVAGRLPVGVPLSCAVVAAEGSPPLEVSDFGLPFAEPAGSGSFSELAVNGSDIVFTYFPTSAATSSVVRIGYAASIDASNTLVPYDEAFNSTLEMVSATVSCDRTRLTVGSTMTCTVAGSNTSAPLRLSDFASLNVSSPELAAVGSFSPLEVEGGAAEAAKLTFAFTPFALSADANLTLLLLGSPITTPIAIVGADLTCENLRRHVGAWATCTLERRANSSSLASTDFIFPANGFGSYGQPVPTGDGDLTFNFTAALPTNDTGAPIQLRFNPAIDDTNATTASFSIVIINTTMQCPERVAAKRAFNCSGAASPNTATLGASDFALPAFEFKQLPGNSSAAVESPNGVLAWTTDGVESSLLVQASLPVDGGLFVLRWNDSVGGGVIAAVSLDVIEASVRCATSRLPVGEQIPVACMVAAAAGSPPLEVSDLGLPFVEPAGSGSFSELAVNGSDIVFTFTPTTAVASSLIKIRFAPSIDASESLVAMDGASNFTLASVAATVSCDRTRLTVGSTMTCTVAGSNTSALLQPSDFASLNLSSPELAAVGSFSPLEVEGGAAEAAKLAFTFTPFALSTEANLTLWYSYTSASNPEQRHVVGSSTGSLISVVDADLTCENLRRHVGAWATCTLTRRANSSSLASTDFVFPANGFGSYGQPVPTGDGDLTFNFNAALPTNDTGAPIQLRFNPAIDDTNATTASFSIVIINTTMQCPERVAAKRAFNCSGAASPNTATLGASDFALPAFEQLPGNSSAAVESPNGVLAWTTDGVESSLLVQASLPVDGGLFVLRWNDSVGGGVIAAVSLDVIEASVRCVAVAGRLPVGVPLSCAVVAAPGSPPLEVSDLGLPFAEPAGSGSFSELAVNGSDIVFTYIPTSSIASPVVRIGYAASIDASNTLVPYDEAFNSTLEMVSATVSCDRTRLTVGSTMTCTVAGSNTSALLRPSDFASLNLSSPELAAVGSFSPLEVEGGAAEAAKLAFTFTPFALSTEANLTLWYSYTSASNPEQRHVVGSSTGSLISVVDADLTCENLRRHVGAWATCTLTRRANSSSLASTDFVFPANGFGSYGQPVPTGDGDLTFNFNAALPTNDTGAPIQLRFNPAIDDTNATTASFSIVIINTTMQCPERVAAKRAFNCSGAASPNTATLGASDFALPAFEQLPGNSSAAVESPNGVLAWTTDGVESSLLVQASLPVDGGLFVLRWNDSVGGGVIAAVSLDVIEASVRCVAVAGRLPVGVPLSCAVVAAEGSPPLEVSDFGLPFAEPAGSGSFSELAVNGSDIVFTYFPTSAATSSVVRIGYAASIDASNTLVPYDEAFNSTLEMVSATVSCDRTRLTVGSTMTCTVAGSNTSAPLRLSDFASLNVSSPELAAVGSFSPLEVEGGAAEAAKLTFTFTPFALSTDTNLTLLLLGSPITTPIAIVGADLTCENLRRHVGAWATCTLERRANSSSLASTDFIFPANGFGSYGQPVPTGDGDLTFNFTAALPTNDTGAPIQLRFNPAIDDTNATTASFSIVIINTTMQCPERVAAKRAFNCSGTASPNTATLGASDFALPAFEQLPGNSSAAVESPNGVLAWTTDGVESSLLVQASLPVDGGLFVLRWNDSVGGGIIAAVSLDVIEASVRCATSRLPVGEQIPVACMVAAAAGSPPLEVSDLGLPFVEPAGSGNFSELAVNGSDIVFTFTPTTAVASSLIQIRFVPSIDASESLVAMDGASNFTLASVAATVSCDRTRLTVGSTMTCTVAGSNTSALLRPSDFASLNVSSPELAAVGSFSPLEGEGGAAEAAKLAFTFTPFALSTEANLTLWYSYTSATNPEQRHVVGSSTGSLISVVDADLTCKNLRRHVGAWATCTLTRRANSSSLASTDFVFPANGFGSYGQPVPTGDGDLTFNFTAALPTNDTGAPIQLRFNPAIDDTNATTASFSIVIINTTMQCPERVAAKRAFNCSGAASPNTATLGASDFALPAFEQLPGNSSAAVESPNGVLAWTTDGVESSLLVQASLPVDGGLFVLRWNDSVGGGVIAAVSLDVIEASVRCAASRGPANVPLSCIVVAAPGSPPLEVSDFGLPFAEPAGSGSFSGLAVNGSDLVFTFTPTSTVAESVVRIGYAASIDASNTLVPYDEAFNSTLEMVSATVSCDRTRLTVGSKMTCTVAGSNTSALLRPSDFASLNVSSPELAAAGSFSPLEGEGGAAEAAKLTFTFTPFALSTEANLTLLLLGSPIMTPIAIVGADLTCENLRRHVGAWATCTLERRANSSSLASTDFIFPANGFGSYGQPVPTGDGDLTFNFTAALPTNDTGAPIQLRFNPAIDDTNATTASFSIVIINTTMQCPERVAAKRAFNCSGAASPNTATLGASDFAWPAFEQLHGNSSASVVLADGFLAWTTDGDTVSLFVQVSLPVDGGLFVLRWNDSVGGGVIAAVSLDVIEASVRCVAVAGRLPVGVPLSCAVVAAPGSPPLEVSDFGLPFVEPAGSGSFSGLAVNGSDIVFTFTPTSAVASPVVRIGYAASIDASNTLVPYDEAFNSTLEIVSATVSCDRTRLTIGSTMTCTVAGSNTSAPLRLSDFASLNVSSPELAAVGSFSPLEVEGGAAEAAKLTFTFTPFALSTEANLTLLLLGSPITTPIAIVGADLTCENLRRHVGAWATCTLGRRANSSSLASTDFIFPANGFGSYGQPVPTGDGDLTFNFTAALPTNDTGAPIQLRFNPAIDDTNATTASFSIVIINTTMQCPERVAAKRAFNCSGAASPNTATLGASDFALPAFEQLPGNSSAAVESPNGVLAWTTDGVESSLLVQASLPVDGGLFVLRWNDSVGGGVIAAVSLDVIEASVRCVAVAGRLPVGVPLSCAVVAAEGSPPLEVSDFGLPFAEPAGSGNFSELAVNGSDIVFTFTPTTAVASSLIQIRFVPSIDASESLVAMDGASNFTLASVAATVSCDRTRLTVGSTMTCTVAGSNTSALLRPSDFASLNVSSPELAAVGSFSPLEGEGGAAEAAKLAFTFTPFALSTEANLTLWYSYTSATNPEQRHVVGSSTGSLISVVDADLTCKNLRRHVGAWATCTLTRRANSSSLASTDFVFPANGFGSYGQPVPTGDGDLTFNFTAALPTNDTGAPIQLRFNPAIDDTNATTASFSIVIINTTMQCPERVAAKRAFNCSGAASPNTATLGASDFALPAFEQLPGNSSAAVESPNGVLAWTTDGVESSLLVQASLPVDGGLFVLRWNDSVGGGVIAAVSLDVIEASVRCAASRGPANVPLSCIVVAAPGSPPLEVSDFGLPFAEPAGSGSFSGLAVNGSDLVFTFTPTSTVAESVVRIGYAASIDASNTLVPYDEAFNSTLEMVSATVSCDRTRLTVGSKMTCTVAGSNTSALLRPSDFASLNVSSPELAAAGSFSPLEVEGGAAEAAKLTFTFTPFALSTEANLTLLLLGSPIMTPIAIVGADLTCENLRRHVGAWATCTLERRANSSSLASTDFIFPANGFGSYGQPVPTGDGDLTFNFTAALPTNDTGAPIQLRFNPAIDDTNATTASFSIVIINTTMQCPERVAAKRAFNCSGAASPNTATLGASDFAWPAFEQLHGNSSASVVLADGFLAWTTDGDTVSLFVQVSLPVDGVCSPPLEVSDFGLPFVEPAGSGSFSGLAVNGSDIVFTFTPTSAVASPVVRIGYAASIDASNTLVPYDEAFNSTLEIVSATVSGGEAHVHLHALRTLHRGQPDVAVVGLAYNDPIAIVGADLTCENLRRHVGAWATCTLGRRANSSSLASTDFIFPANGFGSYGQPVPTGDGDLTFNFTAALPTNDTGAPIQLRFNPAIDDTNATTASFSIVIINTTMQCPERVAAKRAFNCSGAASPNTATLGASDFALPAFEQLPGNSSAAVESPNGVLAWTTDGVESSLLVQASLPVDRGLFVLRWNDSVGGGVIAAISLDVIEASVRCAASRGPANVPLSCIVVAAPGSPPLEVSDFGLPFAEPAGSGSFSGLAVNGSDIVFTFTPTSTVAESVVRIGYAASIDASNTLVPYDEAFNSTLEMVSATVSCDRTRLTIGSKMTCTVAGSNTSALLRPSDFAPGPEAAAFGAFSPLEVEGGAAEAAKLTFTFTPFALSTDTNLTLLLLGSPITTPIAIVGADLTCENLRRHVGAWATCTLERRANSSSLASTDFIFPANGFGSYGQPVPTGDGDLTFNFTAALPTNDTGAPIQLRFNPAIDDTNATTASFSIVVINTTMQCPERVAAKRAFNCSGAASPNTATLGASDFALPAFEQLPGNSSAAVESPNGVLAWTTDGVESSLLVQASLPVDGGLFVLRWNDSVGGGVIAAVSLDVIEATVRCAASRGPANVPLSCIVVAAPGSPPLEVSDFGLPFVEPAGSGSFSGLAVNGSDLVFTFTPTSTVAESVVRIGYAASIDASNTLVPYDEAFNSTLEMVSATVSCDRTRLTVGSKMTCTVAGSNTSALLRPSDFAPGPEAAAFGAFAPLEVEGGAAEAAKLTFTFTPFALSTEANLTLLLLGSPITTPIAIVGADLTCENLRRHVGAWATCTLERRANSSSLASTDFVFPANGFGSYGQPVPTGDGDLTFNFTAALPTNDTGAPIQLRFNPAIDDTNETTASFSIVIINTTMQCPERVAAKRAFNCSGAASPNTATLGASDFAWPAFEQLPGNSSAAVESPNGVLAWTTDGVESSLLVQASLPVDGGLFVLRWNDSVGGGVIAAISLDVIEASVRSPPLEVSDFGLPFVEPAGSGSFSGLAVNGSDIVFTFTPTLAVASPVVRIGYAASIDASNTLVPYDEAFNSTLEMVSATVSCDRTRLTIGSKMTCTVAGSNTSALLRPSDFASLNVSSLELAAVGSFSPLEVEGGAAEAAKLTFTFTPFALSTDTNLTLLLLGSPIMTPIAIVGADLTCENLRRHVGAWATCTLERRANSSSLASTDFIFPANGFGSYGQPVPTGDGDLTFNFTAALPTNDTGAPIQLRFNPAIDDINATTASFSVIIINTTMQCPERVAAKRAFNCSGAASPNTATLGASDFALPAFEFKQLPGNSSAAVESPNGVLAWTTDGVESSLLVQASLPVDGGLFVLRWNDSVGGGVIAAVSLDVIEASVRSPPLEVSDFGLPFVEPAGSGSFSGLAVNGSDIVFTFTPTSAVASPVVRIGYAASIDASNTLVPYDEAFNSTLEMVSATVSCDRTRLTIGSKVTCTVAGSNTSALLRPSDFAPGPEAAAFGAFAPLEVEGGAAEAAKLTFTFTPFALSTEANLTLLLLGSPITTPIAIVGADLTCENLRRHVGAWATCTLERRANSSSLASTDFIFPANGFGSYGQPVPTGDGDLTFNFTAALPTNDTGAPIQLRFNPAIDDTNATTASFSIVVINTTMQCPERVAAKRAFNCSGAASPNTATLGASDFALPAFEQLPGNSSAAVESPNGFLAWTTDGVTSLLLVQASLPVDGGLFVLRWNDSVGGGVIAAVSLDVIEASVRCDASRGPANVPLSCVVVAAPGSPPLEVSDFGLPFAEPAGSGSFSELAVNGSDIVFTFTPNSAVASPVVRIGYATSIDSSQQPVAMDGASNVTFATLSATVACDRTRLTIGSTMKCTVAGSSTSALLRPSDFEPLVVSSPELAAVGSFSPLEVEGGAAEAAKLTFTFTPFALFSGANLTLSFVDHGQGPPYRSVNVSPSISVASIAARLECASRDVILGTSPRCNLLPLAGSADLLVTDFQAPAISSPEALHATWAPATSGGGLSLILSGQVSADDVQLSISYSTEVDDAGSQIGSAQLQVVGTMRVLTSNFETSGNQIRIVFTQAAVGSEETVAASEYLADAAPLGAGATAYWSSANTLVFESSPGATLLPGGVVRLRQPICADDGGGTGGCFNGSFTVAGPEEPAMPVIRTNYPESSGWCQPINIVVSSVSGAGGRDLRYQWTCVDDETCKSLAAVGVDLNSSNAVAGKLSLPSKIRPVGKTYQLTVVGENFLGARSPVTLVSPYKSMLGGTPPLLTVDAGRTLQTKSTWLTTVKVVAQRIDCENPEADPEFYSLDLDSWIWIRSDGITVKWSLPASISTTNIDLTTPTLVIPKGYLPPGETITATMTAVDTLQMNLESRVSISISVIPEPLTAHISSYRGRVSPFRAFVLNASHSSDPDYGSDAAIAAGKRSDLSYQWLIYSVFNASLLTEEGEAVPPTLFYKSTASASPIHTFVPSEVGLVPGKDYSIKLVVTASRFVNDQPYGNATSASTSITLELAAVDVPLVTIQSVFPAQTMYVRAGQPIRIRCGASKPESTEATSDWAFEWSLHHGAMEISRSRTDGNSAIANISALAISTSSDTSTLVLDSSASYIARNRIYNVRCAAWSAAEGISFAGTQDVAIRIIGGPSAGTCSVHPESGIALSTQFVVTCTGAFSSYTSDPLLYQLWMKTSNDKLVLSQPAAIPAVRALLPAGEGEESIVNLIVRISDTFGTYTDVPLKVKSALPEGLGSTSTQAEREAAVSNLVEMAKTTFESLKVDGDKEASLAAVANVAMTLKSIMGDGSPKSMKSIATLLGPMLDIIDASVASSNITSAQASQGLTVGANIVDVFVQAGDESNQVAIANILTKLLGDLDPCTDFDGVNVNTLVVGAGDSLASAPTFLGGAANGTSSSANATASSPLFGATKSLIRRFASASVTCAICGDKPQSTAGKKVSVTTSSVCTSSASSSTIRSNSAGGNDSLPSAGVNLPSAVQALAVASANGKGGRASVDVAVLQFAFNPYTNAGNASAAGNVNGSSVVYNVKSTVVEVEVDGLVVKDLAEPIRFEIPFGPEAQNVTLPMALLYYDQKAMLWKSCGNITELVEKPSSSGDGKSAIYGVGYCDHLTPFGVGPGGSVIQLDSTGPSGSAPGSGGAGAGGPAAPPASSSSSSAASGTMQPYQGDAPVAAAGVSAAAAVAIPVVLGIAVVVAVAAAVLFVVLRRRRNVRKALQLPYARRDPTSGSFRRQSVPHQTIRPGTPVASPRAPTEASITKYGVGGPLQLGPRTTVMLNPDPLPSNSNSADAGDTNRGSSARNSSLPRSDIDVNTVTIAI